MLEVLSPTSPYEDKDTDSVLERAYNSDVDFANFFLEMAAQRSFSFTDDSPSPAQKMTTPEVRGGDDMAEATQAQADSFSPPLPLPAHVKDYETRPLPALPALPGRRNSTSSNLSKELDKAFAIPQRSTFSGGDNDLQKPPAGAGNETGNETDSEETEIRVLLDRHEHIKDQQLPQLARTGRDVRLRVPRSQQSDIFSPSPQPKLAVQKLLRLTGGSPKAPTIHRDPATSAMSMPSGHNSKHKIQQLMGVDVAPRESISSDRPKRSHWAHDDDDMYDSDQDVAISEGSFLDSDHDDSESEPETPSTAPIDPHRLFHSSSSARAESPVPAPLAINKKLAVDSAVRPNTSGGERKFVSHSQSRYREDLYHRTASQLSRLAWRHSGHSSSVEVASSTSTATRESHGTSFGSGSQLLKIESNKVLSPPPRASPSPGPSTAPIRTQEEKLQIKSPENAGSPMTISSSPGLPIGGGSGLETGTPPRKRATSTGAFGNIGHRWQSWQQRQQQSPQPQGQYAENKAKPPYDPATDPHPGIRIILPFELEEEEFSVNSPSQRQSIVSKVLKRISGSSVHSSYQGHMKRPSEPTTPTWLMSSRGSPTSSPTYPQSNQSPFSPANKPGPTSNPTTLVRPTTPSIPALIPEQSSSSPPIRISPPIRPATATSERGQPRHHQNRHQTPHQNQHQHPHPNNRSSFSISEPPSPILTSNALQGRISSLGFRSPPHVGQGIRAITASSTLLAQRTNELVGQATKKLISIKDKARNNSNSDKDGSSDKSSGRETRAELWREGMKSRIKVLDDGGRVLGVSTGKREREREGSVKGVVPERPERSPIVPFGEMGVGVFPVLGGKEGGDGKGDDSGSGSGSGGDSTSDQDAEGQERDERAIAALTALAAPGVISMPPGSSSPSSSSSPPPPVPPRSKARSILGLGVVGTSAAGGSGTGTGEREGYGLGIGLQRAGTFGMRNEELERQAETWV